MIAVRAAKSPRTLYSDQNLITAAALRTAMINTALHLANGGGHFLTPFVLFAWLEVFQSVIAININEAIFRLGIVLT
jgi:hypothetical protein